MRANITVALFAKLKLNHKLHLQVNCSSLSFSCPVCVCSKKCCAQPWLCKYGNKLTPTPIVNTTQPHTYTHSDHHTNSHPHTHTHTHSEHHTNSHSLTHTPIVNTTQTQTHTHSEHHTNSHPLTLTHTHSEHHTNSHSHTHTHIHHTTSLTHIVNTSPPLSHT